MPSQTRPSQAATTPPREPPSAGPHDSDDSGEWYPLVEHSSDDDDETHIAAHPPLPFSFPNLDTSARHAASVDRMQAVMRGIFGQEPDSASFPDLNVLAREAAKSDKLKFALGQVAPASNESDLPRLEYYVHLFLSMLEIKEIEKTPDQIICSMLIRGRISYPLVAKYSWPRDLDTLLECIHSRSPPAQYPPGDFGSTIFPRRTKEEDLDAYLWRVRKWCIAYFTRINSSPPAVQSFAQQMWFSHCVLYPEIVDSIDFTTAVSKFRTLTDVFVWFRSQPKLRQSLVKASPSTS